MADREKVICGWERCRKHTCPSIDSKEYADCEYTVGLYCRQDLLIDDTIALLNEQQEQIDKLFEESASNAEMAEGLKGLLKEQEEEISRISKAYLDIAGKASKKPEIVRCKDCKKRNSWECWQYFFGRIKIPDDWFCADGEKRDKNA